MKRTISEEHKSIFLHILNEAKYKRVNICTQKEMAEYMECSLKKIVDFENGKIFDFWLLCDYAKMFGIEVKINYESKIQRY